MITERKRNERAVSSGKTMGIAWNWMDNDKIPYSEQTGKFNSEAKRTHFSISLFADDNCSGYGRGNGTGMSSDRRNDARI